MLWIKVDTNTNCNSQKGQKGPPPLPKNKSRKIKIVWFDTPFSKNVEINIGKVFFDLIRANFPKEHVFNPLINKNNVKISYSCLPNLTRMIAKENGKVIKGDRNAQTPCSFEAEQCPVEQKCESKGVVYQATLSYQGDKVEKYVGLTERSFKARHKEHYTNF